MVAWADCEVHEGSGVRATAVLDTAKQTQPTHPNPFAQCNRDMVVSQGTDHRTRHIITAHAPVGATVARSTPVPKKIHFRDVNHFYNNFSRISAHLSSYP